jgi:choline dehydrogenase-like flavoprotein
VIGIYADPIETWNGPPQTVLCDEFARLSGPYGFRLETAPAHPGLMALAAPWHSARDHRQKMQQAAHICAIIVLTRDRRGGRVRLSRSGYPIIEYVPDKEVQVHLQRGVSETARLHAAAGAISLAALHTKRFELEGASLRSPQDVEEFCRKLLTARLDGNRSTLFSAHQMGTCAMGTDPRRAVCGPDGQVFGVRGLYITDASAFPASSGVNPMITIMALAHHTVQRMFDDRR